MTALQCRQLSIDIGSTTVCDHLDLDMEAGQSWAVLGKNGSGKTTLLHTLAGLRPPRAGDILLEGENLQQCSRRSIARRLGIVFQQDEDSFSSTVMESVLIGRHPYLDWMQRESAADILLAEQSLDSVGLLDFRDREIHTLSGGERRRTRIACLLVQQPHIAILDEPDNHLDVHHQIQTLSLLREFFRDRLLLMSAHDINLASRFSTHALLLFGDGETLCGRFSEVVTADSLGQLYGITMREITQQDRILYYPA